MSIVRQIDLKHHVDERGQLVKTSNGTVIPETEPTILFRGRDWLCVPLLMHYRELCIRDGCNEHQLAQIDGMIDRFKLFAQENPGVMKQPGITRGL